jgi:tetratricopeptide (TPR) repeat protein
MTRGAWWAGFAFIVVVTITVYIPALRAGFIWDDDRYLTENPYVQTWSGLRDIWIPGRTDQWYPLVFLSFWIEHRLWGFHPLGYHAVNILLHVTNALLLWAVGRRLRIPGAWFVAAVFALHPVHVESVAWVTERKNTLSAALYLCSLWAYLRFDRQGRRGAWAASLGLFVSAMLSKSVTCTLPVVLLLTVFHLHGRVTRRDVLRVAPFILLGIAFGLHTAILERQHVGAEGAEFALTFVQRVLNASWALWFYAWKVLWPGTLLFVYPKWSIDPSRAVHYLPLVACGGVVLGAVWMAMRRRRWEVLLLVLFVVVTLFPALGFFNVYPFLMSYVADHFNYLGSIGYIVLLTLLGRRVVRRVLPARIVGPVLRGAALAVLLALAARTYVQGALYTDARTLWARTLEANPDAWIAMINLAGEHVKNKQLAEAEQLLWRAVPYPEASYDAYKQLARMAADRGDHARDIELCRKSLEARPAWGPAYYDLGIALRDAGQRDESLAMLGEAARIRPDNPLPHRALADLLFTEGRKDEGVEEMAEVLRLTPQDAPARREYASMLWDVGRYGDVIDECRRILETEPEDAGIHFLLIRALVGRREYVEAWALLRSAVTRFPEDGRFIMFYAWVTATCPDDRFRNGGEALRVTGEILRQAGPTARLLEARAAALAEVGRFSEAVEIAQKALRLAADGGDAESLERMQRRIEGYRMGRPCRDPLP